MRLENLRRTRRIASWVPPCRQSAQRKRTVRQVHGQHHELDPKVNPSFALLDPLNQQRDHYQIIGEDEAPLGDVIHTNL
jgi:hypothetical protein